MKGTSRIAEQSEQSALIFDGYSTPKQSRFEALSAKVGAGLRAAGRDHARVVAPVRPDAIAQAAGARADRARAQPGAGCQPAIQGWGPKPIQEAFVC